MGRRQADRGGGVATHRLHRPPRTWGGPGYVAGEFGFRKPPGGRSWEITHVGSGLKVASVDSLEQAKAVAYAIGAKGDWKFKDAKKADQAALKHGSSVVRMLKGEDWAGIMDAIGGEGQSERLSRAGWSDGPEYAENPLVVVE